MPAATYAFNYPGDQQFLGSSLLISKSNSKKEADKNFHSGSQTANYNFPYPGDQQFA